VLEQQMAWEMNDMMKSASVQLWFHLLDVLIETLPQYRLLESDGNFKASSMLNKEF
jgi:hypothetical protein